MQHIGRNYLMPLILNSRIQKMNKQTKMIFETFTLIKRNNLNKFIFLLFFGFLCNIINLFILN